MKNLFIILMLLASIKTYSMTIHYEVSFPDPHTHNTYITMTIGDLNQSELSVHLPVWTPGSYMVREYAQHIDQFDTYDGNNKALVFDKADKNSWVIQSAGQSRVVIKYRVYCFDATVRTNFIDADHAALNGAATFLYPEGGKDLSAIVEIKPNKAWKKVATSLKQKGKSKWIRISQNYDELVDSPIEVGNFEEHSFKAGGIPHTMAIYGPNNGDNKKFVKDVERVCNETTAIFGHHPCENYLFIIHNTENRYNGLEHLNSTVCQVPRWDYYPKAKYQRTMGLMSHEYFHLWNVKRIRPAALGPFDYDNENYTKQLWVVEGITSYYDDYILLKSDIFSKDEYLNAISKSLTRVVNNPGADVQSLTEASHDAWIKSYRRNENSNNNLISYYTKGSMVSIVLNFIIMNETKGKKSLTDVMRKLYADYRANPETGYTEAEFLSTVEEVAGIPMNDFFQRHIYGIEPLDYAKYYDLMGLELINSNALKEEVNLGMALKWEEGRLMVKTLDKNYAAHQDGLNVNDEIVAIENFRVFKDYEKLYSQKKVGDTITFLVDRGGIMRTIEIKASANQKVKYHIVEKKRPGKLAKKLREIWLGK